MKKRNKILNRVIVCILTLAISLTFSSFNFVENKVAEGKGTVQKSTEDLSGELKVHFIDVGQGDCILIQQGNYNMLIDGGTGEAESAIRNYLTSQKISTLNYAIGTHAHEDHIGSLDYVINSFNIGNVYFPRQIATTKCFENFINACYNKNLKLNAPRPGDIFFLGDAVCIVLAPQKDKYNDINDSSIVLKITFGNTSFIMTGDAGIESENEMLANNIDLKADVLKVGHHGSKTATSSKFLNAVNPKYSVISVGKGNTYNLPNADIITRLNNKSIKTYRTDEIGTVVAVSDGEKISFNGIIEEGEEDSSDLDNIEGIVYWTTSGKVYHCSKSCSYLKNSIDIKEGSLISCPKTSACSKCAKN